MPILAAVEGGGTTYVVALARDRPENIIERASFPTTTPEETLAKCKAWLAQRSSKSGYSIWFWRAMAYMKTKNSKASMPARDARLRRKFSPARFSR